jgi:molybdopterin-binding protein
MNVIGGIISTIVPHDSFNRIEVNVADRLDFVVLTLGLRDSFREHAKTSLLFKETDVIIEKGTSCLLSVENRFPCYVTAMQSGKIFVELELQTSFGKVRSIVDQVTCSRLNIVIGDEVNAYVKANEISLMLDT